MTLQCIHSRRVRGDNFDGQIHDTLIMRICTEDYLKKKKKMYETVSNKKKSGDRGIIKFDKCTNYHFGYSINWSEHCHYGVQFNLYLSGPLSFFLQFQF